MIEGGIMSEWLRLFRSRKKNQIDPGGSPGRTGGQNVPSATVFTNWRMAAHATSVGRAGSSVLKLTRFRRGCLGKREKEDPQ